MNLELMSNSKARRILTHVPVILTYKHSPVSKPHQTDGGSAKTPHFDRVQVLAHSISDRKKTKQTISPVQPYKKSPPSHDVEDSRLFLKHGAIGNRQPSDGLCSVLGLLPAISGIKAFTMLAA